MLVIFNGSVVDLPDAATIADLVIRVRPPQPFAVAVNMIFVPRNLHDTHALHADDRIELIIPVTGG
jgi:sulfur carrier protein